MSSSYYRNSYSRSSSPRNGRRTQANKTIAEIVGSDPNLGTLATLVTQVGLFDALNGQGSFTLFAPSDSAFANLPSSIVRHLTSASGKDDLTNILLYHVVPAKITSDQISSTVTPATLQGKNLCVYVNGGVHINDATVTRADIMASNGVIHIIDTVLTPLNGCSSFF